MHRSSDASAFAQWLFFGAVAAALTALTSHGSYDGERFYPASIDPFYHAARVLDALQTGSIPQFDARVHSPDGTWITWPWGYDTLLFVITRLARSVFAADPLTVLAFIPPAWVLVNMAALVWLARAAKLSTFYRCALLLSFAVSPVTQELHAIGEYDHHMAELTALLCTLAAALNWLEEPDNRKAAVLLGVVLGLAPLVHNGLFILQLPLLTYLLIQWARGMGTPATTSHLLIALCATTMLAIIPSQPAQRGFFVFYLLSWFHVYIAVATTMVVLLTSRLPFSRRNALLLVLLATALALPLRSNLSLGVSFITAHIPFYREVDEVRSPFAVDAAMRIPLAEAIRLYSGFLLLLPVACSLAVRKAVLRKRPSDLLVAIFTLFCAFFVTQQFRFHYYSVIPFFLPLARELDDAAFGQRRSGKAAAMLVIALCFAPSIPQLLGKPPLGGTLDFELLHGVFPAIAKACDEKPGVVLADHSDGHYLRLLTKCTVIANVFQLTQQDVDQIALTERLMRESPEEVVRSPLRIDYVFARRQDNVLTPDPPAIAADNRPLELALLFHPDELPPEFQLAASINLGASGHSLPLARFYRIAR